MVATLLEDEITEIYKYTQLPDLVTVMEVAYKVFERRVAKSIPHANRAGVYKRAIFHPLWPRTFAIYNALVALGYAKAEILHLVRR